MPFEDLHNIDTANAENAKQEKVQKSLEDAVDHNEFEQKFDDGWEKIASKYTPDKKLVVQKWLDLAIQAAKKNTNEPEDIHRLNQMMIHMRWDSSETVTLNSETVTIHKQEGINTSVVDNKLYFKDGQKLHQVTWETQITWENQETFYVKESIDENNLKSFLIYSDKWATNVETESDEKWVLNKLNKVLEWNRSTTDRLDAERSEDNYQKAIDALTTHLNELKEIDENHEKIDYYNNKIDNLWFERDLVKAWVSNWLISMIMAIKWLLWWSNITLWESENDAHEKIQSMNDQQVADTLQSRSESAKSIIEQAETKGDVEDTTKFFLPKEKESSTDPETPQEKFDKKLTGILTSNLNMLNLIKPDENWKYSNEAILVWLNKFWADQIDWWTNIELWEAIPSSIREAFEPSNLTKDEVHTIRIQNLEPALKRVVVGNELLKEFSSPDNVVSYLSDEKDSGKAKKEAYEKVTKFATLQAEQQEVLAKEVHKFAIMAKNLEQKYGTNNLIQNEKLHTLCDTIDDQNNFDIGKETIISVVKNAHEWRNAFYKEWIKP